MKNNASENYRSVPISLQIKMLFSGVLHTIGWGFLITGMITIGAVFPVTDFSSFYFDEQSPQTKGVITKVKEDYISFNDQYSDACFYSFKDAEGQAQEGIAYGTNRLPKVGDEVQIQYLAEDPNYSRIVGLKGVSKDILPYGFFFTFLIFPIIGVVFLTAHWASQIKDINLLKNSLLTKGTFNRMAATKNKTMKQEPIYNMVFDFVAKNGNKYEAIARTHKVEQLRQEAAPLIFYKTNRPERSLLKDVLPGPPNINEQGKIAAPSFLSAMPYLIMPGILLVFSIVLLMSLF